ncbi:hypothetical protein [Paraburkholderia ginsengiterrae]|nr:hypothetical protein [Paraburkholderia ginsengiterrae]
MSDKQERKGTMYAFATMGARTKRGGYEPVAEAQIRRESERV